MSLCQKARLYSSCDLLCLGPASLSRCFFELRSRRFGESCNPNFTVLGLNADNSMTGITQEQMLKQFRGEIVYNQEVDKHFPHLTVGQTLEFAARVRTPEQRLVPGLSRETWAKHMCQVVMAVFGLSHTYNTKVFALVLL